MLVLAFTVLMSGGRTDSWLLGRLMGLLMGTFAGSWSSGRNRGGMLPLLKGVWYREF